MKNFALALLPVLLDSAVAAGTLRAFQTHKLLKNGEIVPIEFKNDNGNNDHHNNNTDHGNPHNQDL